MLEKKEEMLDETVLDYLKSNKFEEVEIGFDSNKDFIPNELLASCERNDGILIKSTWGNSFEFVDKETDTVVLTTDDLEWLSVVLGLTTIENYEG